MIKDKEREREKERDRERQREIERGRERVPTSRSHEEDYHSKRELCTEVVHSELNRRMNKR